MAKRMLVDATHPEETRVVVVNGNRLDEFDFEIATRKQLKGNIYLARVTRVEPSLQAAFVEYGGNRHGFLAFSEIHPDYYRIPASERERLAREIAERDVAMRDARASRAASRSSPTVRETPADAARSGDLETGEAGETGDYASVSAVASGGNDPIRVIASGEGLQTLYPVSHDSFPVPGAAAPGPGGVLPAEAREPLDSEINPDSDGETDGGETDSEDGDDAGETRFSARRRSRRRSGRRRGMAVASDESGDDSGDDSDAGGEAGQDAVNDPDDDDDGDEDGAGEDAPVLDAAERLNRRLMRTYKIQDVIQRQQILLVQVAKEERGTKGAALTTYLSLPGRYCVLMPNTGRGGGISRKITNAVDRKRLKEIISELEVPEGMAVILRTAGLERSKMEIRRDFEYLIRLWDGIRELTLRSMAPALVYEEAHLIKRSIRDLYTSDIDEILVEGEAGYHTAKDFMRMLMPSHSKKVQPYRDEAIPLFFRYQVESQIDAMHSPTVQLRSGGYIVINATEALVAIDVNSGRATKERNIEETALKTNQEAADEIARQLRLRDLAGLIVIDFIDMEEPRNNAAVERRLKEAMKNDRARIQVGRISSFGLLELSRQRLRPSLVETNFGRCPHCEGTGLIRSVESTVLYVLRAIEEEGTRKRSSEITVWVPTPIALYILNQKRDTLAGIELRYGLRVFVQADDTLIPPDMRLERIRARVAGPEDGQAPVTVEQAYQNESGRENRAVAPVIGDSVGIEVAGTGVEADKDGHSPEIAPEIVPEVAESPAAASSEEGRERRRRRSRRGRRRKGGGEDGGFRDENGSEPLQALAAEESEEATADGGEADAASVGESVLTGHIDERSRRESAAADPQTDNGREAEEENEADEPENSEDDDDDGGRRRRRRGKRGGRRRGRVNGNEDGAVKELPADLSVVTLSETGISETADASEAETVANPIVPLPVVEGGAHEPSEPTEPAASADDKAEASAPEVPALTETAAPETVAPEDAPTEIAAKPKRSRRKKIVEEIGEDSGKEEDEASLAVAPSPSPKSRSRTKAEKGEAEKTTRTPKAQKSEKPEQEVTEPKPKRSPRKRKTDPVATEIPVVPAAGDTEPMSDAEDGAGQLLPESLPETSESQSGAPTELEASASVTPELASGSPRRGWWRR